MALMQPFIEQSVACGQNQKVIKYNKKHYMQIMRDNDKRNNAPCWLHLQRLD